MSSTSSSRTTRKISPSSINKITHGVSKLNTSTTVTQRNKYVPRQEQQIYPQKSTPKMMKTNQTEKIGILKPITVSSSKNNNNTKKTISSTNKNKSNVNTNVNKVVNRQPTPPDMASCTICKRHFANDRIKIHETICEKSSKKKRKIFDPVKQRLKGTEAECMINKIKITSKSSQPTKIGNWRKQHEEFIANIQAARLVKQHLANGGKLSDLPPPPPMDTSHYVPCPHCGRKFDQGVADRHIPKCANIKNNKPKITTTRSFPVANKSTKLTKNKINITRKR